MLVQRSFIRSSFRYQAGRYVYRALYSVFMGVLVFLASAVLFAVMMRLSTPAASGSSLRVEERRIVVEDVLLLSHIFEGLEEGEDRLIGRAPDAGELVFLSSERIERLARRYGLDWESGGNFKGVWVVRSAKLLSHQQVREELTDYLEEFFPQHAPFELIADQHDWSTTLPISLSAARFAGTQEGSGAGAGAGLSFINPKINPISRRFTVQLENRVLSGQIDPLIEVPVLTRAVSRGQLIRSSDVRWQETASRHVDKRMVISEAALVGKEARRNLPENTIVKENDIQKPWMVRRRDLVTIRYRHGRVVLTATGRALEDGKMGEVIRLKNEQSGRVIEAEITATQNAQIPVSGQNFLAQHRP